MTAILLAALLSGSAASPAPSLTLSCPACLVTIADVTAASPGLAHAVPSETRIRQLEGEIGLLDDRIRHLEIAWPPKAIAMATVGYVLAPLLLPSLLIAVIGAILVADATIDVGAGVFVASAILGALGGVGLVFLIVGIVQGVEGVEAKKSEKAALRDEREALKRELESLRGPSVLGPRPLPATAVLTFRF